MSNLNTQRLGLFLIMGVGILFAFFAGNYVAEEDYTPIAAVIAGMALIFVVFGLGKSIYLLIPICWGMNGRIPALPLPFSVSQLVVAIAGGMFIADVIFKKSTKKSTFDVLDLWIAINIIYIAIGFIRNPVGVAAIGGSARVGGKPYVDLILGCFAYLILIRFRVSPALASKIPKWVLYVTALTMIAGAVGTFFPSVGMKLMPFYSDFAPSDLADPNSSQDINAGDTRFGFLLQMGLQLIRFTVCKVNPTQFLNPKYLGELAVYSIAILMIMLSGFRTAIINTISITILSSILRDRIIGAAKIGFALFVIAVVGVSLSYTSIKLPFTFQRSLSFLPGNWDEQAVGDAKDSSEWRYELWEKALNTDKYIRNKIFGDGFGFLREDFERSLAIAYGQAQLSAGDSKQEMFLLNGDYHSGPVGAIRFVGYVGLALLLPLLYLSIQFSLRIIKKSEKTPFQFCVLFFALPTIMFPFTFLFVFGDYRSDVVQIIYNIGIMKMLSASLYEYKETI